MWSKTLPRISGEELPPPAGASACQVNHYTKKGVRLSFLPFAFAYSAHWWTDTEGTLAAALEEMPAGYADRMLPVIENTPGLVIALVLVIPVALVGMKLAEIVLKKQAARLK